MKIPLFFPPARLVKSIGDSGTVSLAELCELAGVRCAASGSWVGRRIRVVATPHLKGVSVVIRKEPEDYGSVEISVSDEIDIRDAARLSLGAMAYGLMDLVARQSIKNQDWTVPAMRPGRPRAIQALSGADRQRRLRAKRQASKLEIG
jgi:hypothetical protein